MGDEIEKVGQALLAAGRALSGDATAQSLENRVANLEQALAFASTLTIPDHPDDPIIVTKTRAFQQSNPDAAKLLGPLLTWAESGDPNGLCGLSDDALQALCVQLAGAASEYHGGPHSPAEITPEQQAAMDKASIELSQAQALQAYRKQVAGS